MAELALEEAEVLDDAAVLELDELELGDETLDDDGDVDELELDETTDTDELELDELVLEDKALNADETDDAALCACLFAFVQDEPQFIQAHIVGP